MPKELTPDLVRSVWYLLQSTFQTTVVPKQSALEMQLASKILGVSGFLSEYATTIVRRIYIPFEVGVPGDVSLVGQCAIAAHEHQHVEQLDRDGFAYLWRYLNDPSARMRYEVEAYRSTMEVRYWLTGQVPDPDRILSTLSNYKLTPEALEDAGDLLRTAAADVTAGNITTRASQVAINWLGYWI